MSFKSSTAFYLNQETQKEKAFVERLFYINRAEVLANRAELLLIKRMAFERDSIRLSENIKKPKKNE